ncbi:MAG: PQQ-dependent sugar dehydrogenase [Rubrivivax sp.]
MALATDFATSRRIFLAFAEPGSGAEAGRNGTAVGTGVLNAAHTAISGWTVIFRQSSKVAGSQAHFGGRIVPAPDGTLFVTLGELDPSERPRAQDLGAGHGKVMRIRADGSAPADNSVRRPRRRAGDDLVVRPPQRAGRRAAPHDRRAGDQRARPARRRRSQPHARRAQLRLAAGELRLRIRRPGGCVHAGGRR